MPADGVNAAYAAPARTAAYAETEDAGSTARAGSARAASRAVRVVVLGHADHRRLGRREVDHHYSGQAVPVTEGGDVGGQAFGDRLLRGVLLVCVRVVPGPHLGVGPFERVVGRVEQPRRDHPGLDKALRPLRHGDGGDVVPAHHEVGEPGQARGGERLACGDAARRRRLPVGDGREANCCGTGHGAPGSHEPDSRAFCCIVACRGVVHHRSPVRRRRPEQPISHLWRLANKSSKIRARSEMPDMGRVSPLRVCPERRNSGLPRRRAAVRGCGRACCGREIRPAPRRTSATGRRRAWRAPRRRTRRPGPGRRRRRSPPGGRRRPCPG